MLEPARIKISAHLRVDVLRSDCSLSNWYALKFLNFSSFDMRLRHGNSVLRPFCTESAAWQFFSAFEQSHMTGPIQTWKIKGVLSEIILN